eukprot:g83255.t1
MRIIVKEGESLPILDRNSSDPYVKVSCGKLKFKTNVKKKTLNPKWNEDQFIFPDVGVSDEFNFRMLDEDLILDELMGAWRCSVGDLMQYHKNKSGAALGAAFKLDKWFKISDKYPNARCLVFWGSEIVSVVFTFEDGAQAKWGNRPWETEKHRGDDADEITYTNIYFIGHLHKMWSGYQ